MMCIGRFWGTGEYMVLGRLRWILVGDLCIRSLWNQRLRAILARYKFAEATRLEEPSYSE